MDGSQTLGATRMSIESAQTKGRISLTLETVAAATATVAMLTKSDTRREMALSMVLYLSARRAGCSPGGGVAPRPPCRASKAPAGLGSHQARQANTTKLYQAATKAFVSFTFHLFLHGTTVAVEFSLMETRIEPQAWLRLINPIRHQ
eukprot:scaffold386082_cov38-Prasinocladus_malaysianus.AAC.2